MNRGDGRKRDSTYVVEKEPVGDPGPGEALVCLSFLLKVIHELDLSGQNLFDLQALELARVYPELGRDETLHSRCVSSISNILLLRANGGGGNCGHYGILVRESGFKRLEVVIIHRLHDSTLGKVILLIAS